MMDLDTLWVRMYAALQTPLALEVPAEPPDGFVAWSIEDDKGPALWTKPSQGQKQTRLAHRKADVAAVYAAWQSTRANEPGAYRRVTVRGHYLFALARHVGLGREAHP